MGFFFTRNFIQQYKEYGLKLNPEETKYLSIDSAQKNFVSQTGEEMAYLSMKITNKESQKIEIINKNRKIKNTISIL